MLLTDKTKLKEYATENRLWQGIPGIEVTKKGRVFATFYSGKEKETIGNYCVLVKSDNGEDFSEPIAVACPDAHGRCFDPCLWIDPLGRLWFFWAYMPEPGEGTYAAVCDDPDADELVFRQPVFVGRNIMMNKPTVLSTGEWLLPLAVWAEGVRVLPYYDSPEQDKRAFAYKSVDNGKTFTKLGGVDMPRRCFDEHMILELNDGRLAMYVRTYYGIGVSYSFDRGKTWTEGEDSGLGGPCSRFYIGRLRSGRILLINHAEYCGRNNLTALLSEDEGKTWKYKLLLDGRNDVSYPDVKEDEQGYLYIVYDRERGSFKSCLSEVYGSAREILYAKITEEDVMAGKLVNPESRLKRVISKLGKYAKEGENPFSEFERFSERQLADYLLKTPSPIEKLFDFYSVHCANMQEAQYDKLDACVEQFKKGTDKKDALERLISLLRAQTGRKNERFPVVDVVKKVLLENWETDLSVKEIAKKAGMSEYYMMHLFKKCTGTTVMEYRNSLRISKAKELLIRTKKTILAIALECGFDNASYFSEFFKKIEGISPSEYRKLLKKSSER